MDIERIVNTYGEEYREIIYENKEDIKENLLYMAEIGFSDVEDIFERCTPIFIRSNQSFREKVRDLVIKLGINYVELIENDLGLLEELEW